MKVDCIQTSFAGGEFGPSLFGRTDIAQYANACEIVENFLVRPYGSLISSPGSRYVATVSDSSLRTRLLKFVFNRSDAYAIETGDRYMRFFTNRGQVVEQSGTEDLTTFGSDLKAHWKCNDNVTGTGTTLVLDAVGTHNGTASTVTSSLSTTAIVSSGFDLDGRYHVSVSDHDNFTRTASAQPMTLVGWFYYENNGTTQALISKSGEYDFLINSSDELSFNAYSGNTPTVLLLHMDGTDASTTFTDSSASAHSPAAQGNAQIDTAQSKFGGGSGLFDGTTDAVAVPDSADWDWPGDFTVDFWARWNDKASPSSTQNLISHNGGAGGDFLLRLNGNDLELFIDGVNILTRTVTPSNGTWYHIAITRASSSVRLFWNGVQQGAAVTDATSIVCTSEFVIGGAHTTYADGINGWIDEFRVVKGTAVWETDFTPSADAYQGSVTNTWEVDDEITEGWHLIAFTFKGIGTSASDCKIYIDGSPVTVTFTGDPGFVKMENTTSLFRIGTTSSAGSNNWKGIIDNIAFLHAELTATQIASLYTTSAYQISTVFDENEVFDIQYAQLNDIIWLSHPSHPPQRLIRTSANDWTISNFNFIGGPFLDDNTTSTTITASATTGTVNLTVTPTTANLFTLSSSTLGHHNSYWMIGGLAQTNTTTGLQEVGYVQITHVINSYTATATVIKNLKTSSATTNWAEGAWSAVRGYPGSVIFHDSRLWFARTSYEPQKLWGSKIFEYDQFGLDTQAEDDALNLQLASNESNEIQWLASAKNLIAGTFGGAFVISSGGDDVAITPDNVHVNEEIGIGSASVTPKRLGGVLVFLQRFKKKLREMFYFWDLDTYKAIDKTILAPHILGDGVIDMDYQQNPDSILYCVTENGEIATLTREVDQEVTAWSRQTTNGTYSSIAIIPSQTANYDEAWVIVERWINGSRRKYVEYFENPEIPERQDLCLYLHSALTYNAYEATSDSNASISLSASSGSVTVTSSTGYFVGTHVNKRLRAIDENGTTIGEGTITATSSTTSITLSITTTFNALRYSAGRWGVSVVSVSGLDHLNAKTVGILADGNTESLTRTVASNTITMGSNYFVIHVGLSYDQILFALPKEAGTQRGTAQGKLQRISEIALKVNRSTQHFKYGTDADNLDEIDMAFTPTVNTLYTGIIPSQGGAISMRGGYKRGAKVYLKNSKPLPLEILSIMGALDTNEK